MIFIKFPRAKWTLAPLTEPGLYPIKPKTATWFIDKNRQHSILAVQRRQVPLAAAFAITSHAAQGQTLLAAIVDLQIARGSSPLSSYVALTRVKMRQDVLIYKPFDHDIFTQGPLQGPSLLLRALRGEDIDWKEIEKSFTPSRPCSVQARIPYLAVQPQRRKALLQSVHRAEGKRRHPIRMQEVLRLEICRCLRRTQFGAVLLPSLC